MDAVMAIQTAHSDHCLPYIISLTLPLIPAPLLLPQAGAQSAQLGQPHSGIPA